MAEQVNTGLFGQFRQAMTETIDQGIALLESEQSKVNKAVFDSMTMEQRDAFCQSLKTQGLKSERIERITGKSASTVHRHVTGKNS